MQIGEESLAHQKYGKPRLSMQQCQDPAREPQPASQILGPLARVQVKPRNFLRPVLQTMSRGVANHVPMLGGLRDASKARIVHSATFVMSRHGVSTGSKRPASGGRDEAARPQKAPRPISGLRRVDPAMLLPAGNPAVLPPAKRTGFLAKRVGLMKLSSTSTVSE